MININKSPYLFIGTTLLASLSLLIILMLILFRVHSPERILREVSINKVLQDPATGKTFIYLATDLDSLLQYKYRFSTVKFSYQDQNLPVSQFDQKKVTCEAQVQIDQPYLNVSFFQESESTIFHVLTEKF